MTGLVFPLPQISAPVEGLAARFPVRRIYCVGRNYADHAREMGSDPLREPPFFFSKFPDALLENGATIAYPPRTRDFQFEAELVIAIGAPARNLAPEGATSVIFGYACGLDMTRRDLQNDAKKTGRPWDMGKNFTGAAPLGPLRRIADAGPITRGTLRLFVNGAERQTTDIDQMIWSPSEIISHLSNYDALAPGDLIFTGTPAGVAPVKPADQLHVTIDGLPDLSVTIGE